MIPGINEPHYLCKAKSFVDPTWCHRDFFLASSNAHFCFYQCAGPLTHFFSLSTVAILGRLISFATVAWGWCRLGRCLNLSPGLIFAAAATMVLISKFGSFSGEWIIGGFESKVPAWGLVLAGIPSWISFLTQRRRKDAIFAGMFVGLATALHPVVGLWTVIAFGMVQLFLLLVPPRIGEISNRFRQFPIDAFWLLTPFGLIAILGVLPAVQLLVSQDLSPAKKSTAEFIQVFWRLKHHMDPTEFTQKQWLHTSALMVAIASFILIGWRKVRFIVAGNPRISIDTPIAARWRLLICLLGASMVIAFCGVAIGWHNVPAKVLPGWQWRATLLKFYPFRLFDGLLPTITSFGLFGLIQLFWSPDSFACATDSEVNASHRMRLHAFRMVDRKMRLGTALLTVVLLVICYFCNGSLSVYTSQQFADWQQACLWLKSNTPVNSLVLTPRESYGFKWFAERAEYVTYKDCPQDAAGILEWNRRLWFLNGWTLQSSKDEMYDTVDLVRLREETTCDYLLTRILGPFDRKPMYQVGEWQIYDIPTESSRRHSR